MYGCCVINPKDSIIKLSLILNLTMCRRDCVCFLCVGGSVFIAQETTSNLTTRFLVFQSEAVAIDSTHKERSHHNQETRSEEDFTFTRTEEYPLKRIFPQSTEQTSYNAEEKMQKQFQRKKLSSENSEFKQTSADIHSTTTDHTEEEPKLQPQDLLIWALVHNKFERFSELLKVPGVDPKFKYDKPHYTTCIELACRLEWGGKFVKILLQYGVKPNVQEIHPEPIHYAAKYGNSEALEALLQNKRTKVNVVDSSG